MWERSGNARAVLGHGYGVVLVAERGETVLQNFRHHVAVCAGERRVRLEYELYGLLCRVRRNSGIGCGGAVRRAALSRVCGGKQHHSGQNAAYHPFFHWKYPLFIALVLRRTDSSLTMRRILHTILYFTFPLLHCQGIAGFNIETKTR